jgi:hypothetical protein
LGKETNKREAHFVIIEMEWTIQYTLGLIEREKDNEMREKYIFGVLKLAATNNSKLAPVL